MMKFLWILGVGFAVWGMGAISHAQQEAPARKKFIQLGWDQPSAATLREHLADMEKTPFDGVILRGTGKNDEGKWVLMAETFSDTPWKKEWFQESVDHLQAVRSTKLTDNFVRVGANPGNVDWFDDEGWKQVVDHWSIAAWFAREGKLKGICFDPEPYQEPFRQFDYQRQAGKDKHSFAEYQEKARQRGREVMRAISGIDPHMVILTLFMNSVNVPAARSLDPAVGLESAPYGLYPAFINGWLDEAPPEMIFVDGSEIQGYRSNTEAEFLRTANWVRHTTLSLVAPENRRKHLAQVQNSSGLYLDSYINPPTSNWYLDPKGLSPVLRLHCNATFAARAADEYVWIYGEKYRWWPTPSPSVGAQSWEEVLPGIHQALTGVSRPEVLIEQKLSEWQQQGKPENLLRNGDFAQANEQQQPAGWNFWEAEDSNATLLLDEGVNFEGSAGGAAKIAQSHGSTLYQWMDIKDGDQLYVVRVRAKRTGGGDVRLRIAWRTAENQWVAEGAETVVFYPADAENDSWQLLQAVVIVPAEAVRMAVMCSARIQATEQDAVWFDEAEVYRVSQ